MLSEETVRKILKLNESGLTQREIAGRLGVGRSTVANIVTGKRRIKRAGKEELPKPGPVERCKICGVLASTPCLACLVRGQKRAKRLPDEKPDHDLKLKGAEHQRYLEVRSWRRQMNDPKATELPPDHPLHNAVGGAAGRPK